MDMSPGEESEVHPGIPAGMATLTIGVMELGVRGVRWTLGRAFPSDATWDLAVGAAAAAGDVGVRAITAVRGIADPVFRFALRPPLLPHAWRPARVIETLEQRGQQERNSGGRAAQRILDILVPAVVEQLLDRIDLNSLVKQHLDIEAIVADMDLDAVVDRVDVDRVAGRLDVDAILDRVDLNAIVRERVDLDAIVASVDIDAVASRLDVDAILDRVDLNAIVRERVDLDAIVANVDIDAVATRLDVNAVLDRIDLTAIVRERVDVDAIVAGVDIDAVASRLDIHAVIDRIDLAALAEEVIEAIDLPEIIRDSTGSMASEAVRGVRMQSIEADEAVARVLDRVFRRRRTPPTSSGSARLTDGETLPIETEPLKRAQQ
jgi:hypothetical protein